MKVAKTHFENMGICPKFKFWSSLH